MPFCPTQEDNARRSSVHYSRIGRQIGDKARPIWCTVSHIMVMSLRSKWAVGKVAYASCVYLYRLEAYATLKPFFRPAAAGLAWPV